ncbi:MAG TPA: DUF72 domain-containing protein [Gemmatimonadaceae bacterium]|nr:DUF72 domain-containing protein [Gemmatimonadaceae bacterium]
MRVGISGYDYPGWRGDFYPDELPRSRWLAYASRQFESIELNGTFYSLKSPAVFVRWDAAVPKAGFVFALKGGRFITHNLKLRRCETALGNYFASGVLALGRKTGPFLWQLPDTYGFDPDRLAAFMDLLPRDSVEGEVVARWHDDRLRRGALVDAAGGVRVHYRHAFEVRHPSYFCEEFYAILRAHHCALVLADSAGRWGYAEELTADFVYVRLHGAQQLYVSGYTPQELDWWAARIEGWRQAPGGRDVYVYFDNDAKVYAPRDAMRLRSRLQAGGPAPSE